MNAKLNSFASIIYFSLLAISCGQKNVVTADLPIVMDDSSKIIIDRAIEYAGGYDVWQQKKTLSFDKKSSSFDSTGQMSRQTDMHLDYMIKPEFRAKLTYMRNDTAVMLMHDGQKARKFYNGKIQTEQKDTDGAWNSSFGSQFVMCMPFKLKDPGIQAEYMGRVKLKDGTDAQLIKTSYIKGAGSNPDHIWYYYFEPGTGKLLANSFNGKDNYWDYTRYEEFERTGGLLLPAVRKGYTATGLNMPGRLVSDSRHSNMEFDKKLPENNFAIADVN